ncbi:MAG TPA: MBL fold metallo-hydrolase, partial [Spirochaetia bacterium]
GEPRQESYGAVEPRGTAGGLTPAHRPGYARRMIELHCVPFDGPLGDALRRPAAPGVTLYWLGQAGFAIRWRERTLLIDPYLSDTLGVKYKGRELAHERMMPVPVDPATLRGIDAVLCTHRHGDHMDPGTLPLVARGNPDCRFVVPEAERDQAIARGAPADALVVTDAGRSVAACDGVAVEAIPSSHETLSVDEAGHNRFLGYVLRLDGLTLYHSGDCVPYDGLEELLRRSAVDVALLPVNGRSSWLAERDIAGNFTLAEAADLCRAVGIPYLLCHHFGMFAFNTVDETAARSEISRMETPRAVMAETGVSWVLGPGV